MLHKGDQSGKANGAPKPMLDEEHNDFQTMGASEHTVGYGRPRFPNHEGFQNTLLVKEDQDFRAIGVSANASEPNSSKKQMLIEGNKHFRANVVSTTMFD
jgi:hypothetical protein